MTEWTTIRVRKEAKDEAERRKPDGMTWSEYLASEEYAPVMRVDLDYHRIATETADELETRLLIDELQTALRSTTKTVPHGHIDVSKKSNLRLADEARELVLHARASND